MLALMGLLAALGVVGIASFVGGIDWVMASQCDDAYQDAKVAVRADGIHFDGTITEASIDRLVDAIQADTTPLPTVWLESGGGDVGAALYFALMAASHPVRMAVGKDTFCASACVILYLAGTERQADPSAAFGLHAPYCGGTLSQLECLVETSYKEGDTQYRHYMQARDPVWYAIEEHERGLDFPPERTLCFSFLDGAAGRPSSEHSSDASRANCALAQGLAASRIMKPEYRTHEHCPVGLLDRLKMIKLWAFGDPVRTARHDYPE